MCCRSHQSRNAPDVERRIDRQLEIHVMGLHSLADGSGSEAQVLTKWSRYTPVASAGCEARRQASIEQAMFAGIGDGFQAAVDVELVQNALDVVAHGGAVDHERPGDAFGFGAMRQQAQHLQFALG